MASADALIRSTRTASVRSPRSNSHASIGDSVAPSTIWLCQSVRINGSLPTITPAVRS